MGHQMRAAAGMTNQPSPPAQVRSASKAEEKLQAAAGVAASMGAALAVAAPADAAQARERHPPSPPNLPHPGLYAG